MFTNDVFKIDTVVLRLSDVFQNIQKSRQKYWLPWYEFSKIAQCGHAAWS